MLLIGISGKRRRGKDEAAKAIVETFGFKKYAFADEVRKAVHTLNPYLQEPIQIKNVVAVQRIAEYVDAVGWESAKKLDEVRRLLQVMGTDVGRKILGDDVWINAIFRTIQADDPKYAVISDVRFPNEVEAIEDRGGFVLRIERTLPYHSSDLHESETALDGYKFKHVIVNDAPLDKFKLAVLEFVGPLI